MPLEKVDFLIEFYSRCNPEGLVELRFFKQGRSSRPFFQKIGRLKACKYFVEDRIEKEQQRGFNAYFGIATRRERSGKKESCYQVPGFWVDIDTGADHKKQTPFNDPLEAVNFVNNKFNLEGVPESSYIVFTGGGLHLYYLLEDGLTIRNDSDIQEIESINQGLQELFSGDCVKDVSRVMRIPGTYNLKTDKPRLCEIYSGSGKRYPFEVLKEFRAVQPVLIPVEKKEEKTEFSDTIKRADPVDQVQAETAELSAGGALQINGLTAKWKAALFKKVNPDWVSNSEWEQAVITQLLLQGMTESDIRAVFFLYPVGFKYRGKAASSRESYLSASIQAARDLIEKRKNQPKVDRKAYEQINLIHRGTVNRDRDCKGLSMDLENIIPVEKIFNTIGGLLKVDFIEVDGKRYDLKDMLAVYQKTDRAEFFFHLAGLGSIKTIKLSDIAGLLNWLFVEAYQAKSWRFKINFRAFHKAARRAAGSDTKTGKVKRDRERTLELFRLLGQSALKLNNSDGSKTTTGYYSFTDFGNDIFEVYLYPVLFNHFDIEKGKLEDYVVLEDMQRKRGAFYANKFHRYLKQKRAGLIKAGKDVFQIGADKIFNECFVNPWELDKADRVRELYQVLKEQINHAGLEILSEVEKTGGKKIVKYARIGNPRNFTLKLKIIT